MKHTTLFFGSLLLLLTQQLAFADVPVTISNPTPALINSYAPDSSSLLTYTITNNVPKLSFPLKLTGINNPVTRSTVENDCGNQIPAGPSVCNIGIVIAPTVNDADKTFHQILLIDYQGRMPLSQPIDFSVSTAPMAPSILTAVGADYTGNESGIIAASHDLGKTWQMKTISNLPNASTFSSTSCTGSGINAICTAAGTAVDKTQIPLLAQSTNGGMNWGTVTINNLPATGLFKKTSCTGEGATAICTAVGREIANNLPLLAVSTNGGNSWDIKNITYLPKAQKATGLTGEFSATSCTGAEATAICSAVGTDTSRGFSTPLVAVSTDGGNHWNTKSISHRPFAGFFNSVSCTGNVCAAAGMYLDPVTPLLAVSTDGGNNWETKTIPNLPKSGFLAAINCTGADANPTCIASGRDTTGALPALLVMSTDGGDSWSIKTVANLPNASVFISASCSGNSPSATCSAVGKVFAGDEPALVATSTDGGSTWETKKVTDLPNKSYFTTVHCMQAGNAPICIAAGRNLTGSLSPYLATSLDGGNIWNSVSIPNLPTTGIFNSTGSFH